jgi:hypothetical protein
MGPSRDDARRGVEVAQDPLLAVRTSVRDDPSRKISNFAHHPAELSRSHVPYSSHEARSGVDPNRR